MIRFLSLLLLVAAGPSAEPAHSQTADTLAVDVDPNRLPEDDLADREAAASAHPGMGTVTWLTQWTRGTTVPGYRHAVRVAVTGRHVAVRAAADHDPGEALVLAPVPVLADHVALSVAWSPRSEVAIVAGTFRAAFFHGLVAGRPRFGGPHAHPDALARRGNGLRPWAAGDESTFRTGVGLTLGSTAKVRVSAWASTRQLDARADSSGNHPTWHWVATGRHATTTERARRGNMRMDETGAALEFGRSGLATGILVVHETLSRPLCTNGCLPNPPGRTRTWLSAFASVTISHTAVSAECALGWSSPACVASVRFAPSRHATALLSARRFGFRPWAILSGTPSVGPFPDPDESGIQVHWRIRLSPRVRVRITADVARSTDDRTGLYGRSLTSVQRVDVDAGLRGWNLAASLARSLRRRTISATISPGRQTSCLHRIRIRLSGPLIPSMRLDATAAWHRPIASDTPGSVLMSFRMSWTVGSTIHLDTGVTEHAAPPGSSPLVHYEPDSDLAFPLRFLYESGRRWHARIRWDMRSTRVTVSTGRGIRYPAGPLDHRPPTFRMAVSFSRSLG